MGEKEKKKKIRFADLEKKTMTARRHSIQGIHISLSGYATLLQGMLREGGGGMSQLKHVGPEYISCIC